jgi:hypothetical protein
VARASLLLASSLSSSALFFSDARLALCSFCAAPSLCLIVSYLPCPRFLLPFLLTSPAAQSGSSARKNPAAMAYCKANRSAWVAFVEAATTVRARPGRSSARSVFHSESSFYDAFCMGAQGA